MCWIVVYPLEKYVAQNTEHDAFLALNVVLLAFTENA